MLAAVCGPFWRPQNRCGKWRDRIQDLPFQRRSSRDELRVNAWFKPGSSILI
jgi:hypothetical protein